MENELIYFLPKIQSMVTSEHYDFSKEFLFQLKSLYDKNNIYISELYGSYFHENSEFFSEFLKHYKDFIKDIDDFESVSCLSNIEKIFLSYVKLYIKQEANQLCDNNGYYGIYNSNQLFSEANMLLETPLKKESILLRGDLFLFNRSWLDANDEYVKNAESAHSYFQRGYLLSKYADEEEYAIKCFKNAIDVDPNYYLAQYYVGKCYEYLRQPHEAVEVFDDLIQKLANKKLIYPIELECKYYSETGCARIYKNNIGNGPMSSMYSDMANETRNQLCNTELSGLDSSSDEEVSNHVKKLMLQKMNVNLDEIY